MNLRFRSIRRLTMVAVCAVALAVADQRGDPARAARPMRSLPSRSHPVALAIGGNHVTTSGTLAAGDAWGVVVWWPLALLGAFAAAVGLALRRIMIETNREIDALARRRSERARRLAQLPAQLALARQQLDFVLELSLAYGWNVDAELRVTAIVGRRPPLLVNAENDPVGRHVGEAFAHLSECDAIVAAHRRACDGFASRCSLSTAGRRFDLYFRPQPDERGATGGAIGICMDVTTQEGFAEAARSGAKAVARARAQALSDPLTGLPNRAGLFAELAAYGVRPRAAETAVAVLFVEFTGLETTTETLGFAAGDEFVVLAAQRLAACAGANAFVARFCSARFVVVLRSVAGPSDAGAAARTIVEAFGRPLIGAHGDVCCTPTIGIAYSASSAAGDELVRDAGTAMLSAKARGRDPVESYRPALRESALEHLTLERDLRSALDNGELRVHYQPIVSAAGRVLRFEALVRWMHPTRGLVAPSRFIAYAEACGLIVPLGAWVVEQACSDLPEMRRRFPGAGLAVNVSPRQLQSPGFEQLIRDVLTRTHTDPQALEIEITETMLMSDMTAVLPVLVRLRASGITISLDDFGTGYSSLAYLKRLPVDTLKIDQSFVRDISFDQLDGAIARTIVKLAHGLGLRVAAEGVETEIQRSYLEHVRCDQLQGFLFSEPLPSLDLQMLPPGPLGLAAGVCAGGMRPPGGLRIAAGT